MSPTSSPSPTPSPSTAHGAPPAARQREVLRRLGGTEPDPALRLTGWEVDGDTVALRYHLDGLGALVETVRFPGLALDGDDPVLAGAVTLVHLAAATSYHKAVIPRRVVVPPVPPAAVAMLTALLGPGLGEFAARNDLDLAGWTTVVADEGRAPKPRPDRSGPDATPRARGVPHQPNGPEPAARRVLVPVGGGKDSAVTAAVAVRSGWDVRAFAVNPRASMHRTAEALGVELCSATRRLDPRLLAWNDAGALNGHIPITAIVTSIALVAAVATGRADVLMSNEASADEATRTIGGRPVNHQYSKSSAFEALHRAASDALTGGAVRAFSLLRPLPELAVAAAFSHLGVPLTAVNSCNRAYALTAPRREWCGTCPKCLFVQVMLAPFTTPAAFRAATGFDALADAGLVGEVAALLDPATKPYECVGTVTEVQLALDLLAADPDWAGHAAVAALGRPQRDAAAGLDDLLAGVDPSDLPTPYDHAVTTLVTALRTPRQEVT